MWGFVKGLLSSDSIVENGMKAMDKMILTNEEKADLKLEFIKATMPMNRSRRFIAMAVTGVWVPHICLATGLFLYGYQEFEAFMEYMKAMILQPFNIILGFYFLQKVVQGFGK